MAVVGVGLTVPPYNANVASNNASDLITPVCAGVRSVTDLSRSSCRRALLVRS